jgi:AraC-like DNA-binding protein
VTTTLKSLPPHGTLSRHKYHGCKCDTCRDFYRTYQRSRYRKQAYGTWQPLIDAEPVRQHLEALRAAGISFDRVAEQAGLYTATVTGFVYDLGPKRPRKKRVRPETAAKILAVRVDIAQPGIVDATGTRRRLQALAAVGWPFRALGPHLDVAPQTVARLTHQRRLYATTAETVTTVYTRLSTTIAEDHGIPAASAARARNRATAEGWRDPQYWDDMGHIDDPTFNPDTAEQPLKRAQQVAEDAAWLLAAGYSRDHVATRLGVSRFYIDRALREATREETAA